VDFKVVRLQDHAFTGRRDASQFGSDESAEG